MKSSRPEIEQSFRQLQSKFSRFYSKLMMEMNLSIPQFSLLILVYDEGPMHMSKIAEGLYITCPTVTSLVDRLEENAYLVRKDDPQDRRACTIHLTAKGRKTVEVIRQTSVGRMAEGLGGFSQEEIGVVLKCHQKMAQMLDMFLKEMTEGKKE